VVQAENGAFCFARRLSIFDDHVRFLLN
jgi:hypothetical protein